MAPPIRTALLGFGLSGRVFHGPLIAHDPAFSLDVIVTGNPERAASARRLHPTAEVVGTAAEALARDLDLVVIGTPPGSHFSLAEAAIDRGLAVVVDKPFVPTGREAEALIASARAAGTALTVYQNRRWDADFLTLRQLIEAGELGQVHTFESRFERWKPEGLRSWKGDTALAAGGGILADLGSHLIDQALQLFGPVRTVHGETTRHAGTGEADDDAFVSLLHESGVRSRLSANLISAVPSPRFRVLGSTAGYVKWGLDSQERALGEGVSPGDPQYGVEPEEAWGTLGTPEGTRPVPAVRGAYPEFYRLLGEALTGGGPLPVDPEESLAVIRVIEEVHRQNRAAREH